VLKKKLLYSRDVICHRVKDLADEISRDYEGKEVVFIGVLKGSFIFMADLLRCMKMPHSVDFVKLASYGSGSVSSGKITITTDMETDIEGKDVIVLEDIIDTGITMAFLMERLKKKKPASLKICALMDKKQRREISIDADYVGFAVDEGFIVGYGLDFNEQFRCLPDIYVIEEHDSDYPL